MASELGASLVSALQAAASVELTLFYGYAAAAVGFFDASLTHKLTRLCTSIFIPCLIIVQCGPELDAADIRELWVIFAWAFLMISIGFGLGLLGKIVLKLPGWAVVGCALNNANAMPLLLLESLSTTGALDNLAGYVPGETSQHAISRGKMYILLYMLIQQTYGFAIGPRILTWDKNQQSDGDTGAPRRHVDILQDEEHVGLLDDDELGEPVSDERIRQPVHDLDSALDYKPKLPRFPRFMLFLRNIAKYLNPPLIGALIAFFLGFIPPLHYLLLDQDNSPLYPSLTRSVKNLGDLYTSLQMFTLGSRLYLARKQSSHGGHKIVLGWVAPLYVLGVRFLAVPLTAAALVYALVRLHPPFLRMDPMMWFVMIVAPSGPTALLLASMADLVKTDEAEIAAFLFITYLLSPFIAVIVTMAIRLVETLQA